jgi:hypothetical protein
LILEDAWTLLGLGALAEFLLGVALWRTRRGALVAAIVLVAVLTGLGVLVEWLVVTDREAVEDTLRQAAAAVCSGDEEQVLRFVAPEAEDIREDVRRYLSLARFTHIAINQPQTQVFEGAQRTARVRFTARGSAEPKGGYDAARREFVEYLEVRFRREGERWLVTQYQRLKLTPGEP